MFRLRLTPSRQLQVAALLSALLLILAGCVSRPQVSPVIAQLPERVELSEVPFFADDSYQGAPGALAALLAQQGLPGDPAQLRLALKLPQEEANLPANIVAEAQAQGLLVAPLQPNLTALLHRVAAGTPVLLRFERGYGVLVGYDRVAQTLLLQSGMQRRLSLDFGAFSQGWAASGQWALSLLHPSQLPAPAAIPGELSPAAAREAAGNSSQALLALHKRWLRAEGPARDALRRQLVEQASQRRTLLLQLAQDYPDAVLQVTIPEDKQAGMPAEVLARLEQRLDLDGELDVVIEDYEEYAKLRHFLRTPFGEQFELRFAQRQHDWRSGQQVRAQGWLLLSDDPLQGAMQGDLLLADDQQALQLMDGGTTSGAGEVAYDLPNVLGAQRTLVILVNFQDAPSNQPWTNSQVTNLVFGTVNDFYLENSAQQTWITGQVAGWYTVALNSTTCDTAGVSRLGKEAAQAAGYNVAQYDRLVFIFPQVSACGFSGAGQVGAWPSTSWINGSMILRTIAHELGHNLGLRHAFALDCGSTTLGSSCTSQEYGDTLDIMGYSGTVGHFNTYSKERLGWLSGNNLFNVSSAGSFPIAPNSLDSSNTKSLKIAKGIDTASGKPSYYYVEFRQPIGFDAQLPDRGINTENMFRGVTIRQSVQDSGYGYLLDMTPNSMTVDMRDAALVSGYSFNDSAAGISITTEWTDSSQALVSVDLTGGGGDAQVSCTRSAPQISVSPAQSAWLVAGSSYSYSVNVSNMDSAGCASSSFSLAAGKPSGWTTSLPGSLSLAPGASSSVSLAVTSPSSAIDGFYAISSTASGNSTSATASATYVVDNPVSSNNPPMANNDSVVLSSIAAVTIAVLVNDLDSDGDPLTISSFTQGSKGAVKLGSNGTLIYTPVKGFKGSDQFGYSISDGKASASASVSISLQSSGGGGKGRP